MSLLNYTTSVPASRTINEIQKILVKGGARQIMTEYDDNGNIAGVSFSVDSMSGVRAFTLPVKWEPVLVIIKKDPKVVSTKKNFRHAHNVAWRIMKDWIEAQIALVETEMVTIEQVMLPYMRSVDGSTFYEAYLSGKGTQPALGAGSQ